LYDIPIRKTILLVGTPGTGKSTFCYQAIIQSLISDRPIIFVLTENDPVEAENIFKEKGISETPPGLLNYVNAYSETVGLSFTERPDIINVDCGNLTNLGIAIYKLQKRIGKKGILLVFDSLTSPYLLNGSTLIRFWRTTLSRFAGDGNSVLASIDEGSGKNEDLVGLMSLSNGIIKLNLEKEKKILTVVKHPILDPTIFEVPLAKTPPLSSRHYNPDYLKRMREMELGESKTTLRSGIGDFINIAWRGLVFWSGMLWDPKRFPRIMYDLTKYSSNPDNFDKDFLSVLSHHKKFLFGLNIPKNFSKVKDMKKLIDFGKKSIQSINNAGIIEYLENKSKTNEHYVRFYESYECWGFDNVGAPLGFMRPSMTVGSLKGYEKEDRDWNVVETKCIGLGDDFCEYKMMPREIYELNDSLEKDSGVIMKVNERLMNNILGYLLLGKKLMERPTLGNEVHIYELQKVSVAPLVIENLQLVFRMGGAKAGKMLAERLVASGLKEKEAVKRLIDFLEYCKVGKMKVGETIRIWENCERFGMKTKDPSCYFTTGFLNGFFYSIMNKHVRENKCIGIGDSYCEWNFN
jgi:predicted hydrocarbon binding protein/KaiC/GvpD/RAD55 family RecA-like ATPase